jgi:cation transport regulator ChaC
MIWYFAYGSNMSVARLVDGRLRPKGVELSRRIGARLDGWRLTFDKITRSPKGAGVGNIALAAGECVHGTLNEMPDAGLAVLDVWEGVSDRHYERRAVSVVRADNGEAAEAVTYVALRTAPSLRPTREYLGHLLAGRDLLPQKYWEWLKATPTFD